MQFERRTFDGRKKKRSVVPRAVGVLVVILVLTWWWHRSALGAVNPSSQARVPLTVQQGAGLGSIAVELEERGLIRSSLVFTMHVRWIGQDHLLRAGAYVLQPSMTADEILAVLTGGAKGEVSITIPEGYTVADIDRLMAAKGFTATGAIVQCAKACDFSSFAFLPEVYDGPGGRIEGYLYPDTYFVGGEGGDPEAFLGRLLSTFKNKVVDGLATEIAASGRPLRDVVTMASLIEKEAAGDSERATISGILWKRLEQGIILGVDASVRYAVDKPPREPLTQADLRSNSPYNIRAKQGLPPGPIANAGIASIKAALQPETSPYFYYLHGKDGYIRYAVTNYEHNANRSKYLR